jgi:hypothetical protein
MARKRVSLKDKGPETLGLTEKKGKGIDVLLGGPTAGANRLAAQSVTTKSNVSGAEVMNMATENQDALTNAMGSSMAPPPVSPVGSIESLPVNEADTATAATDDLGLPVAMEQPPEQLLANAANRAVDDVGLPVAMETPPTDVSMPIPPAPPPVEVTLSTPGQPAPADDNDLSGLAGEEEFVPAPEAAPVFTPLAVAVPPVPEPTPVEMAPPPVMPVSEPVPVAPPAPSLVEAAEPLMGKLVPDTTTYAPVPAPVSYPIPTPAAPPPPPPPRIESIGGIITEALPTKVEDLLPADYQYSDSGRIEVVGRATLEKDELITQMIERYIGQERREALDQEIERLYDAVSAELSDNSEDAAFALKTLREAQDIVIEDIRQFDEAVYRVAVVKTMLVRRRNLRSWSYRWGSFVFAYAVIWLALFIIAMVFTGNINTAIGSFAGQSGGLVAGRSAWYSALAGGIGGVIGILYSLYWRVAIKQNFDRQYIMYYLVQPIMGFILGAVTHLIITAGFLTFNNANGAASPITVILQLVIGFVAGFRQRLVYLMIDKIVQKIAPDTDDRTPVSVVPEQ